jgi:hypothetical protein
VSRPRRRACAKPLRPYQLNRLREFEDDRPVCGLGAGHKSNCVSEESLEYTRKRRESRRRD